MCILVIPKKPETVWSVLGGLFCSVFSPVFYVRINRKNNAKKECKTGGSVSLVFWRPVPLKNEGLFHLPHWNIAGCWCWGSSTSFCLNPCLLGDNLGDFTDKILPTD